VRTFFFVPVAWAMAIAVGSAQTPAPAQAPAPSPPPAPPAGQGAAATPGATAQTPPPLPENYTYQPDGRRDPFLNLLGTGNEPQNTGRRADGAAGLTVAEIAVSGVLESRGALIAMVQGPDKKTYIVRAGDRFVDGTIRSITPQGLTIVQEVNDPLSLVKQREIHKLLRSLESAKE
jgi:Tfp pilus assembly protein PilP